MDHWQRKKYCIISVNISKVFCNHINIQPTSNHFCMKTNWKMEIDMVFPLIDIDCHLRPYKDLMEFGLKPKAISLKHSKIQIPILSTQYVK